jgi:hypothetical protein
METHTHQRISHQSGSSGHGRVGVPIEKDALLRIHPTCHCGGDEARAISGRRGIRNVQRFRAEIDLGKIDGVHWKSGMIRAIDNRDSRSLGCTGSLGCTDGSSLRLQTPRQSNPSRRGEYPMLWANSNRRPSFLGKEPAPSRYLPTSMWGGAEPGCCDGSPDK